MFYGRKRGFCFADVSVEALKQIRKTDQNHQKKTLTYFNTNFMFTYSFFRNPRNGSLHLRLINNRRKAEMEIGLTATEAEFFDVLSSKPKAANARLALTLKNIENKVREVQMDIINNGINQNIDVKEIRVMIRERVNINGKTDKPKDEESPDSFVSFYKRQIISKRAEGTRRMYQVTLTRIGEFCNDPENPFRKDINKLNLADITQSWIIAFDEWSQRKGAQVNTRRVRLNHLHAVINEALDDDLIHKDPFRKFKIQRAPTRKRSMSVEELRRLFNYPVEKFQQFHLDMFKLIFMLIGINAKDLYNLKEISDDGRIVYRRAKTGKYYSIKVEPEAMEIIERWRGKRNLLCIADKNSNDKNFSLLLNRTLSKIGDRKRLPGSRKKEIIPAFPGITAYWARHTWATIARKLKIPKDDIALALGHSTGHIMTDIYIDEDMKAIDEANRKVISFVLYGDADKIPTAS